MTLNLRAVWLTQWKDLGLPAKRSRVYTPALPGVKHMCDPPSAKVYSVVHPYEVGKMSVNVYSGLTYDGSHPGGVNNSHPLITIQKPEVSSDSNESTLTRKHLF